MKNIDMEIQADRLLGMLSAYYTNELGEPITITASINKEFKTDGPLAYEETVVDFSYVTTPSVLNYMVDVTSTLDDKDIKTALNKILDKLNYSVITVKHLLEKEDGIDVFKGVKLNVRQKGLERQLKND